MPLRTRFVSSRSARTRSRRQAGWTIIELMVVGVIFLIAVGIAVPQFTGQKETADSAEARNLIEQAYEASQDYYAGEQNANISGTYYGITASIMDQIQPDIDWVTGTAITTGTAAEPKRVAIVTVPSSASSQTPSFRLCNAGFAYVYCVVDSGFGPRYGAAKVTTSVAAAISAATTNATSSSNIKCQERVIYAEGLAKNGTCG